MPGMDLSFLESIGGVGLAVVLAYFGYKIIMFMIEQWKSSTEALNKNSEAFNKLSVVFEKSDERQIEFQKEILIVMNDTHKKVTDIHNKFIEGENKNGL